MAILLIRRLAQALGTLLGGAVITFVMLAASPGDPAERILTAKGREEVTPEAIAALRADLGLDRPLLFRLGAHLRGLATGDLGSSWSSGRPVIERSVSGSPQPFVSRQQLWGSPWL